MCRTVTGHRRFTLLCMLSSTTTRVVGLVRPALRTTHCVPSRFSYAVQISRTHNRTFLASAIQTASDGFLDLSLTLPYSELVPPYSATIIITTIVTRILFTVPFSVWVRAYVSYMDMSLIRTSLGQATTMDPRRCCSAQTSRGDARSSQASSTRHEER